MLPFHLQVPPPSYFAPPFTHTHTSFSVIFEATIIQTLVEYWGYNQSPAILITVSLLFYLALNVYRADLFGEAECESPRA